MAKIKEELNKLNERMHNSMPTFSSRYKGHMMWEVSMVGLLGYFAAMLYNQNNVATEGSAVTTVIEQEVGEDLCKMLQFRSHVDSIPKEPNTPTAWGHLTSGGSAANIESAWAARNVKYLAYTIRMAIDTPQGHAGSSLLVTQANGTVVSLRELNPKDDLWTLLNIPTNNALELLHNFGTCLGGKDNAMAAIRPFGPQTLGVAAMPGGTLNYVVPATAHYSWPKAGSLLGLGEDRMHPVPVDGFGRLDVEKLEAVLREKAKHKVPVMLVVAIMGSTAEGAMDPIKEVADMRERLRAEFNFDFNIHADAAWGGYCCAMLNPPNEAHSKSLLGPVAHLSSYVRRQLENIHRADTITLDPHKAGYIQYPAGSICFQNKRLRDLLAYTEPYITPKGNSAEDPSVGTYGIDGSRPGAAAVATYLHHRVTGLNPRGHGLLVGQANLTAKLFWSLLATMADPDDPFTISQIHQPSPDILPHLLRARYMSNDELVYDGDLMNLLQENGPDFLINVFAVNYSYPVLVFDGDKRTQNTDIKQAMKLMDAIGTQLNMAYAQLDPDTTRPHGVSRKGLFLIRDTVYTATYQKAITTLTKAVNLTYDPTKDLEFCMLVSTTMEPWSNDKGFLDTFNTELRQAIFRSIGQLHDEPDLRSFVIVDAFNAEAFGEHVSSFRSTSHNYQTIVKFEFGLEDPDTNVLSGNENVKYDLLQAYRQYLYQSKTYQPLVLTTKKKETMFSFLYKDEGKQWFEADVYVGLAHEKHLGSFLVRVSDILLYNHLDPGATYPANEKYFIFGAEDKVYASHIISKYPNYQHMVELQHVPAGVSELIRELGVGATLANVSTTADPVANPLKVGSTYPVELIRENAEVIVSSITVRRDVWFGTSLMELIRENAEVIVSSITVRRDVWFGTSLRSRLFLHSLMD
eukprot:Phypoly_transcript_00190.p1 GENE.Phypoly_transcript_00190~~Phypoly_transcript_00190.p1  ORF type:complete len:914 (+),score=131.37 Phypoly_transcript_00190:3323-6064(+)